LIFLFFIFNINSLSAQEESCFSVELFSYPQNSSEQKSYPKSCLLMDIGQFSVVRCACYENYLDAKELLKTQKGTFPKAHIVRTYKKRFKITPEKKKIKIKPLIFKNSVDVFDNNYDFFKTTTQETKEELSELENITSQLTDTKELQLSKLKNGFTLYGLSLDAKYDQYLDRDYLTREYTDYEYNIKLQYDFFKNGYFEQTQKNKKNIYKVNSNYYQNLSNIQNYSYEERLSFIETLLPFIKYNYYSLLTKISQENLQKNISLYKLGSIAKYEIDIKEKLLKKYIKSTKRYKKLTRVKTTKCYIKLLKKMERLELTNLDEIKEYILENNSDLLLKESLIDSLNDTNSYFDKVQVSLYISNRNVDENGWYNTVGVDGHFPLDFSSSQENDLQRLQKHLILSQEEALALHLKNSIDRLNNQFQTFKSSIQNSKEEIDIQNYQLQRYILMERDNIASLHLDVHEKIYLLQKSILQLKHDISLLKLEMLKTLIHIQYLMNTSDLNLIIKANKCL
jgi:hypothetical protein